jgi:hypothetical protein
VVPLAAEPSARLRTAPPHGALTFGIRPADVHLAAGGAADALAGRVAVLEPQGDTTVVIADTELGRVSVVVRRAAAPAVGARFSTGSRLRERTPSAPMASVF